MFISLFPWIATMRWLVAGQASFTHSYTVALYSMVGLQICVFSSSKIVHKSSVGACQYQSLCSYPVLLCPQSMAAGSTTHVALRTWWIFLTHGFVPTHGTCANCPTGFGPTTLTLRCLSGAVMGTGAHSVASAIGRCTLLWLTVIKQFPKSLFHK